MTEALGFQLWDQSATVIGYVEVGMLSQVSEWTKEPPQSTRFPRGPGSGLVSRITLGSEPGKPGS